MPFQCYIMNPKFDFFFNPVYSGKLASLIYGPNSTRVNKKVISLAIISPGPQMTEGRENSFETELFPNYAAILFICA